MSTIVDFVPHMVKPLTLNDLLNSKKSGYKYELELVANNPMIDGKSLTCSMKINTRITFNEPVVCYALVDGGWLPPPFVIPRNLLVDRNVVSQLKKIKLRVQRDDLYQFKWWLQFFKGGTLFNPLLYAIEGCSKTTPSFEQFTNAFDEGSAEIASQFQGSRVVTYGKALYEAAYKALVEDIKEQSAQETAFLLETIPRILEPVKTERRKNVEAGILDAASKRGLYQSSLIVIAVLTCLYDQGSPNAAGRGVLKPRKDYSENDAFNAIADLNNLELFIRCRGELRSFALCTCDWALALFWCGLTPHDGHVLDGALTIRPF